MEVHPPHEPVHSWRDALVHIGIMTVGLFIALSLEGFIEYVHHKELVQHARENIQEKLKNNQEAVQYDIRQIDPNIHRVEANITALEMITADPKSSPPMSYEVNFSQLGDTAWRTARDTGALGYMPYTEVQGFASLYGLQDRINADMITIFNRESESLGPVIRTATYVNVSKQDLASAVHENGVALVDLYNLKQLLQGLDQAYRGRTK